ncbi:MAG: site-2 protease family protein [Firmicutes bacterium]|nr:site-2 protease family protein [Bacillota bacterium]
MTNLLPFPPLDGGKIVILLIEAIRRKPLKENIDAAIQMTGFTLLIGLSIYVTYNDILRIM